jgi:hypothetical protein
MSSIQILVAVYFYDYFQITFFLSTRVACLHYVIKLPLINFMWMFNSV